MDFNDYFQRMAWYIGRNSSAIMCKIMSEQNEPYCTLQADQTECSSLSSDY